MTKVRLFPEQSHMSDYRELHMAYLSGPSGLRLDAMGPFRAFGHCIRDQFEMYANESILDHFSGSNAWATTLVVLVVVNHVQFRRQRLGGKPMVLFPCWAERSGTQNG